MSNPSKTFSRCCGTTLIEVLAAIALVGTLLTSVILAHAQHMRQLHHAERALAVSRSVDAMLAQWWVPPATSPEDEQDAAADTESRAPSTVRDTETPQLPTAIPINAFGDVPGVSDLCWQTEPVADDTLRSLGAQIVRLTIMDQQSREVIFTLDLVAALPDESTSSGSQP